MKPVVLSAFAAVLLSGAPQAAGAQPLSVAVPYGDLDLRTPAGRATLDGRIDAAVEKVCARPSLLRDLKAMTAWAECRKSAVASASEQIDAADIATETFAILF